MCEGTIHPTDERKRFLYQAVSYDIDAICNNITHPKVPIIVVNDVPVDDFEYRKTRIQAAFQQRLGDKSSFELY